MSWARPPSRSQSFGSAAVYFNELLIEVNLVLSFVPSPFTTAIIASAMPAAISPYSMAVAPVSSARNLRIVFIRRRWTKGLNSI
jgi:hypothetical protein